MLGCGARTRRRNVDRVIVATDSEEIVDAVQSQQIEVMLTSAGHTSGTDRVAEVAATIAGAEIVVNVQGDEPLISPQTIEKAVDVMKAEMRKPTAAPVSSRPGNQSNRTLICSNPDLVKVVVDDDENAIYFSRSPVPYPRDAVKRHGTPDIAFEEEPELLKLYRKHTGLYVYRKDVLLDFTKWPQTQLEQVEALEQLRALAHGVKIKVVEACSMSIGVDTVRDLQRVRAWI